MEYYRFEPYLRKGLQEYVGMEHREYVDDPNKGPRQFFVSFYDLPRAEKVRSKCFFYLLRVLSVHQLNFAWIF